MKLLKDAGKGVEEGLPKSGQYKFLVEGKGLTETLLKPEMKKLFKSIKSGANKLLKGEKKNDKFKRPNETS